MPVPHYSPNVVELAKLLMYAHGLDSMSALDAAQAMSGHPAPEEPAQAPVAPTPLNAHLATPEHLEDANFSAWQRYSQMLDAAPIASRDPASGQSAGHRSPRKSPVRADLR